MDTTGDVRRPVVGGGGVGSYAGHWATQGHHPPHHGAQSASPPASPGARSTASFDDRYGCLQAVRMTACAKASRFLRRLVRVRHMDFEFAGWQMIYLLVRPQKVYRNFMYRKRTKDQWARDDPAFLVLMSAALCLTSILFAAVLGLSFGGFVTFLLWVVFIDCILVGIIVASALWLLCNQLLRRVRDQDVEWAYCFDVHLNAFFPVLVLLHVVMPLLYLVIIRYDGFFPRLCGNTIWFVALGYYLYITFLGYTALPLLKDTHVFLYPFTFLFIFYVATVTAGWNKSADSCPCKPITHTARNIDHKWDKEMEDLFSLVQMTMKATF